MDENRVIGLDEIAQLYGLTQRAVQARRLRGDLPPVCRRRPLGWRLKTAVDYLKQQEELDAALQLNRKGLWVQNA